MVALTDEQQMMMRRLMSKINKFGSPRSNHELSGCWGHITSVSSNGYGQIVILGKTWNLHRLSWWLCNGCPLEGNFYDRHYEVCHQCDNKECANPDHLVLETAKKNKQDAVKRIRVIKPPKQVIRNSEPCFECVKAHKSCDGGIPCLRCKENKTECVKKEYQTHSGSFTSEQASGENNAKAILTKEKVLEIRRRYNAGLKYGELKKMVEEYGVKYVTLQAIVGNKIWNSPEYFP